jgi:hypothetical protein
MEFSTFFGCHPLEILVVAGLWWLTPVIPATWEAEIRRVTA